MTPPTRSADRRIPLTDEVSSDFDALASHMGDCERSRGRFFSLRSALEWAHGQAASRIVTTGALLLMVGAALLALV